jgi:hypothetical protein
MPTNYAFIQLNVKTKDNYSRRTGRHLKSTGRGHTEHNIRLCGKGVEPTTLYLHRLTTGPPVRLAWLEADCNMLGGGKTGYLK